MGLFSFFSKSPEKSENKGDRYFAAKEYGLSKLEYETALALAEKKNPDSAELLDRLKRKLSESKESLAAQHLETGDNLIEADVVDEAINLFLIAHSLTEDPLLKEKLENRLESHEVDYQGELETEEEESASEETGSNDLDETFEILCAALPEETADEYYSYGDDFKEGYIALSNGDFVTAAEKLKQAMDELPKQGSLIPIEFATALIHLNQIDQAIAVLTDHISEYPTSIGGISLLCDIFCDLTLFDKAHAVIDNSPDELKNSVGGMIHKGRIFFLESNFTEAETIYRKTLEVVGWNDDIARELGATLSAAGKKEEALNLYADILNKCTGCGQRANPLDQKAYADLAFEMDDFSDKTLKLFLDLANDHPGIRSDCFDKASLIYQKMGNDEEYKRFRELAEATA